MGLFIFSVIAVIWGAIILMGATFRLKYYWESKRMIASREMFGDKRAALLHGIIGGLMILVGLWSIFG